MTNPTESLCVGPLRCPPGLGSRLSISSPGSTTSSTSTPLAGSSTAPDSLKCGRLGGDNVEVGLLVQVLQLVVEVEELGQVEGVGGCCQLLQQCVGQERGV